MYGLGTCREGRFKCKTKYGVRCLSNSWKCDWKHDCEDGFDEANCTRCNPDLFQCKDADPPHIKCLDLEWRCDGHKDCDFEEDEHGCNYTTQTVPQINTSKLTTIIQKISTTPSITPPPSSATTPTTPKSTTQSTVPSSTTAAARTISIQSQPTPSNLLAIPPPPSTIPPTTTPSTTTITTTKFPSTTTTSQTPTRKKTTTESQSREAGSTIFETKITSYNEVNEGKNVSFDEATTQDNFETIVQSVLKSPYFVHSILSTVVILVVIVVAVCILKDRRKKRRRRGKLPPIPPHDGLKVISGSFSGTLVTSSAKTKSYHATTSDSPDAHEYEDIEKYRRSRVLLDLAQTDKQLWDRHSTGNISDDNIYSKTTDWTDNNSRRNSSYVSVMQFNNGKPSALTSFYEQPLKSEGNEYLSIQEVHAVGCVLSEDEQHKNKKFDIEDKGKQPDIDKDWENTSNLEPSFKMEHHWIPDESVSEYEKPVNKHLDQEVKGKHLDFPSTQEVSATERVSTEYELPVSKACYEHDKNKNTDTRQRDINIPMPLALEPEPCFVDIKSAQQDRRDDDYIKPINDDYIHPV